MITFTKLRNDLVLGVIVALLMIFCIMRQANFYKDWWEGPGHYVQRIDIPSSDVIRLAALGYDNLYADFLTLRAVQMFGASWRTPEGVEDATAPIFNYFDVLTDLDPHFVPVYELANLIISDDKGDHKRGLEIIRKGIMHNPRDWKLPYLGMYTSLWGLDDPDSARIFLHFAQNARAPEHVLRMNEYIERQSGQYFSAFDINIGHFLRYTQLGMEDEREITMHKFQTILDGWYKLELARAAERFLNATGEHPRTIEDLLTEEYMPRFEAPVPMRLLPLLDYAKEHGLPPTQESQDFIRETASQTIVGLPPDPAGFWYFVEPTARQNRVDNPRPDTASLPDRFDYFFSMSLAAFDLNRVSGEAQEFIMTFMKDEGRPPTHEEMAPFLGGDFYGGHYEYFPDYVGASGEPEPRFASSATLRMYITKEDPRLGLMGTLDDFPLRQGVFLPGLPPYLETNPSIWDFPEDAEWALCKGLTVGLRYQDQPEWLRQQITNPATYVHCENTVVLPPD
jgi:hypothetical protein